jgi:hypothetical protein
MTITKEIKKTQPIIGLVAIDPKLLKEPINLLSKTKFRPLPSNIEPYAAPRPALYRSPSPYARIASIRRGKTNNTDSSDN